MKLFVVLIKATHNGVLHVLCDAAVAPTLKVAQVHAIKKIKLDHAGQANWVYEEAGGYAVDEVLLDELFASRRSN